MRTILTIAAVLIGTLAAAPSGVRAESEPKVRSFTYTVNGKEVTRYFQKTEGGDGTSVIQEVTGPGGRAIQAEAAYDRTESGATRERTTTGPAGGQSTSSTEWIMNSMGFTKTTSGTTASGKAWSATGNVTGDGAGGLTSSRTVTGPDGKTYVYTGKATKTTDGVSAQGTVSGPNGEVFSRSDSWSKTGEGSWSRQTETTGPAGNVTSRLREGTREGNTVTIDQDRTRTLQKKAEAARKSSTTSKSRNDARKRQKAASERAKSMQSSKPRNGKPPGRN